MESVVHKVAMISGILAVIIPQIVVFLPEHIKNIVQAVGVIVATVGGLYHPVPGAP